MKDIPDFLSHYTSISALLAILESRKLRCNRLDRLDDMTEAKAIEANCISKLIYTSSWTAPDSDNIWLWDMYADRMKGIKITLPTFPFALKKTSGHIDNITYNYKNFPISDLSRNHPYCEIVGYNDIRLLSDKLVPEAIKPTPSEIDYLIKEIDYVDNPSAKSRVFSMVRNLDQEKITYKLVRIGLFKHKDWEGQKEIRYRFVYHSVRAIHRNENINKPDLILILERAASENDHDYIYIGLDAEMLNKIKITMGPKTTEEDKKLVEIILKEYLPELKSNKVITKSRWHNELRK